MQYKIFTLILLEASSIVELAVLKYIIKEYLINQHAVTNYSGGSFKRNICRKSGLVARSAANLEL